MREKNTQERLLSCKFQGENSIMRERGQQCQMLHRGQFIKDGRVRGHGASPATAWVVRKGSGRQIPFP